MHQPVLTRAPGGGDGFCCILIPGLNPQGCSTKRTGRLYCGDSTPNVRQKSSQIQAKVMGRQESNQVQAKITDRLQASEWSGPGKGRGQAEGKTVKQKQPL